jgi:hypothetical protein
VSQVGHHDSTYPPADPLPRLSAHDHDGVTVVRVRGELDPSGTAVLPAQLRDIRCRWRARSVADLTGLAVPGRASLSMPARRCKPIRDRAGHLAPGGSQAPAMRGAFPVTGMLTWFEAHDSAGHAVTGTGATRSAEFPALPVQPTIPVAHQRGVILPRCPASGQRRGTF